MSRLTCIVEGRGDTSAFPGLCARIIRYLNAGNWYVDSHAIRYPRGHLVNEQIPSPRRPSNSEGISRVLDLAATREPDAVLIACDSDDDCPGTWGPHALAEIRKKDIAGIAVMSVREYESWLLWNQPEAKRRAAGIGCPETIRDAKGALARLFPNYLPTLHQLHLTQKIDVARVRKDSDSFDKLVRGLAQIFCTRLPPR